MKKAKRKGKQKMEERIKKKKEEHKGQRGKSGRGREEINN
jgi:hypothetical protein